MEIIVTTSVSDANGGGEMGAGIYMAWMVILGNHGIKKMSFENFDF